MNAALRVSVGGIRGGADVGGGEIVPPAMDFVRFADFIRDVREFDFVAVGIESVVFFFGGFAVGGFDDGDWLSGEGECPNAAGEEVKSETAENKDGDSDERLEPF